MLMNSSRRTSPLLLAVLFAGALFFASATTALAGPPVISLTSPDAGTPMVPDTFGRVYPQLDFTVDSNNSDGLVGCTFTAEDASGGALPTPPGWGMGILGGTFISNTFYPTISVDTSFVVSCTNTDGEVTSNSLLITIDSSYTTPPVVVDIHSVTPPSPLPAGGSTVSLTVSAENADVCNLKAYDTADVEYFVPGWTNPNANGDGPDYTLVTSVVTIDTRFEATCSRSNDDLAVDNESVTFFLPDTTDPEDVSVVISSAVFGATGVPSGTSADVTVDTTNADICDLSFSPSVAGSGANVIGWNGNNITVPQPSGSFTRTITVTGDDVVLRADCTPNNPTGSAGFDQFSISIDILPPGLIVDTAVNNVFFNSFTTDPVAGVYEDLRVDVDVINLAAVASQPNIEVTALAELVDLHSSFQATPPADPYALPIVTAAPVVTTGMTLAAAPGPGNTAIGTTNQFTQDISFGTHDFCVSTAVRDQNDRRIRVYDADANQLANTTNNYECVTQFFPVPDPNITVTPSDTAVRNGETVDLDWIVDVSYTQNCHLRGPGGVNVLFSTVAGPNALHPGNIMTTGTVTTGALTSTSKFVLTCTEPITNNSFTDETVVEVVPAFEEV